MKSKKNCEADKTQNDSDTGILASIDIAKRQRNKMMKKILFGFSC